MPVYQPSAVIGNDRTLITLGESGEVMSWFYPSKDAVQQVHQCMPGVYVGPPQQGGFHWTWGGEWEHRQEYVGDTTICSTTIRSDDLGLEIGFLDTVPIEGTSLVREITVRAIADRPISFGLYHYGDWNMGGLRTGNEVHFDRENGTLVQTHRDATLVVGGDAVESWQCGKAGVNWSSNALNDLQDGMLACSDLEIGDVNWACGFHAEALPGEAVRRHVVFTMGAGAAEALRAWRTVMAVTPETHRAVRSRAEAEWLGPGLGKLDALFPEPNLPDELLAAYRRSLLSLPLLCGTEGVAVAAPEFDPEFESCGGYGYFWPRDGAEYVSGLMDAGYPQLAERLFDWCARNQSPEGYWEQRYFLNGQPGPNWCLAPDALQVDQVGCVLWAYGKWTAETLGCGETRAAGIALSPRKTGDMPVGATSAHMTMIRKAADYLASRLTPRGVHMNAFDTWESFIGSFTYSNSALYAAFKTAARVLNDREYEDAAQRVKSGVLHYFVHDGYLTRGFNRWGQPDTTVDSSSVGAIEPFGLLDLKDDRDLKIAETTLKAVIERLGVDFEGGRAIRRFEGDAYVGGAPACVNTLWVARCCCRVAARLNELGRRADADILAANAEVYLKTVLRRATATGLLPELMQGPGGHRYWAGCHGWAMASYVTATLQLAALRTSSPARKPVVREPSGRSGR